VPLIVDGRYEKYANLTQTQRKGLLQAQEATIKDERIARDKLKQACAKLEDHCKQYKLRHDADFMRTKADHAKLLACRENNDKLRHDYHKAKTDLSEERKISECYSIAINRLKAEQALMKRELGAQIMRFGVLNSRNEHLLEVREEAARQKLKVASYQYTRDGEGTVEKAVLADRVTDACRAADVGARMSNLTEQTTSRPRGNSLSITTAQRDVFSVPDRLQTDRTSSLSGDRMPGEFVQPSSSLATC
jgi:hypothetical protein